MVDWSPNYTVLAFWKVSLQNSFIVHGLQMTDNFPSHLFFNFCLSKLYTNSLMSSLNSRSGWKYNEDNDTTLSFEHKQVVRYLFIHSQLNSLCACAWVGRESSLNNLQNQSKPIFVSTKRPEVGVRKISCLYVCRDDWFQKNEKWTRFSFTSSRTRWSTPHLR